MTIRTFKKNFHDGSTGYQRYVWLLKNAIATEITVKASKSTYVGKTPEWSFASW